jgi:hypothetical protein
MTEMTPTPAQVEAALAVLARAAETRTEAPKRNNAPPHYTSDDLPPGCRTRRQFASHCRTIHAVHGRGKAWRIGRNWVVRADDYERFIKGGPVSRRRRPR